MGGSGRIVKEVERKGEGEGERRVVVKKKIRGRQTESKGAGSKCPKVGYRKIIFWNVAGVYNKDKEFWRYIRKFDMVSLSETWVEEKGREKLLESLPKGFKWEVVPAIKAHRKGRAKGRMLIGVKEEWVLGKKLTNEVISSGFVRTEISDNKDKWRIWSVYNDGGIKKILDELEKEEINEEMTIVGGFQYQDRRGR